MTTFSSSKYGDIYFSPTEPEAEKQFVFIQGNRIAERIQNCETFTVAELGFGFGLNCALTLRAAKQMNSLHKLRYFSVDERLPERSDIDSLGSSLRVCPREYADLHIRNPTELENANIFVAETGVDKFLAHAAFSADAWYFDGFSPAKNAAMWSENVFARAFALIKPGGTFSTYSAAGWVRRNLLNAGFAVEKVPGFAGKREMLVGHRP